MDEADRYVVARAKAFCTERMRPYVFRVTGNEVLVWDDVALCYTSCHALSPAAQRRIRAKAANGGK